MSEQWPAVTVGEISSLITSGSTPRGGRQCYAPAGVPFIRSLNVWPGRLEIDPAACITPSVHQQMTRSRVIPGDVLLTITGEGTLGRATDVPPAVSEANINQHVCLIRPVRKIADSRFLSYALNSEALQKQMSQMQAGATRAALNHALVAALRVALPPLPEQRRIAVQLDKIAAKVEEARELRDSALAQAEVLFRSSLSAVLRDQVARHGTTDLGRLIADARYGTSVHCSVVRTAGDVPVLRIPNVSSESITVDDLKYGVLPAEQLQRVSVADGDILIVRTNGNPDLVGRAAVVSDLPEPTCFASYLIRLRCNREVMVPEFLQYVLRDLRYRGEVLASARTSAGQFNISVGRLRQLRVPAPPLAEQHSVVAYLDRVREGVGSLRSLQSQTIADIEGTMSSALDAAFRGRL